MHSRQIFTPCRVDWHDNEIYFRIPNVNPKILFCQITCISGTHPITFWFRDRDFDSISNITINASGHLAFSVGGDNPAFPSGWESFAHRLLFPDVNYLQVSSSSSLAARRLSIDVVPQVTFELLVASDYRQNGRLTR